MVILAWVIMIRINIASFAIYRSIHLEQETELTLRGLKSTEVEVESFMIVVE